MAVLSSHSHSCSIDATTPKTRSCNCSAKLPPISEHILNTYIYMYFSRLTSQQRHSRRMLQREEGAAAARQEPRRSDDLRMRHDVARDQERDDAAAQVHLPVRPRLLPFTSPPECTCTSFHVCFFRSTAWTSTRCRGASCRMFLKSSIRTTTSSKVSHSLWFMMTSSCTR